MNNLIYEKNNYFILISKRFVYNVYLYVYYNNYIFMTNSKTFLSDIELPIVEQFWKSSNIEISTELMSAPEEWLISNGYKRYIKPKKIKKLKPKI